MRAVGTLLGHATSATFTALAGLAALAISRRGFFGAVDGTGLEAPLTAAPERVVVTTTGIWRGEASGLIIPAN